jgi:hypothetical protein
MALTLMIEGRRLRSPDHRQMHAYAGRVEAAGRIHVEGVVDELRASAQELRSLAMRSSREQDRPRPRLLYRDALEQMEEKGLLRSEQATAGREIMEAFHVLYGSSPGGVGGYSELVPLPCGELVPARFGSLISERFLPWREWARVRFTSRARTKTLEDLTALVCVYGYGQQQAADYLRMDRRRLLDLLRNSLWEYCVVAGMVSNGPQEAA